MPAWATLSRARVFWTRASQVGEATRQQQDWLVVDTGRSWHTGVLVPPGRPAAQPITTRLSELRPRQHPSGPPDPRLQGLVQKPDPSGEREGRAWKRPSFLNTVQRADGVACVLDTS